MCTRRRWERATASLAYRCSVGQHDVRVWWMADIDDYSGMIDRPGMQRILPQIFPALFLLCASLANCSPANRNAISVADITEVLTLAANAAAGAEKLPTGYCVLTRLDPRKTVVNASKKDDGWSTASPEVAYRLIVSPKLRQMPARAVASFPASARRSDCRHPLTFHEPEFLEVKRRTGKIMTAIIAIDDYCPLCGAGYSVSFTRSGRVWKVDAPGLAQSWVS